MSAIIAVLSLAASYIPQLIQIGMDVAPLISGLRKAVDQIGTDVSPTDEEFKALDATVAGYEAEFKDAVAAHLKAVGEG